MKLTLQARIQNAEKIIKDFFNSNPKYKTFHGGKDWLCVGLKEPPLRILEFHFKDGKIINIFIDINPEDFKQSFLTDELQSFLEEDLANKLMEGDLSVLNEFVNTFEGLNLMDSSL